MRSNESLPDLKKTGITGLDEVLMGGVRSENIILLEGGPGSGKTTLGLEFIYRGAEEFNESGLVVSFELSPQKLMRDAKGFGWDFESLQEEGKIKVIYTSPGVLLDELQSPDGVLASEIRKTKAKRILIDGIAPLRIYAETLNKRPFRDSLHVLVESLQRFGVTAMLTNEVGSGTVDATDAGNHERFVCDTIITLSTKKRLRSLQRSIEVVKSRGQDFIAGTHTLKIVGGRGIEVFRRTQCRPKDLSEQPTSTERLSTGTKAIDELLGGGFYRGSTTLTVGISGTGKTISGTQFLMEGIREGEKCLLVTLDEHPKQMIRNGEALGFPMQKSVDDGSLTILYDSPLELELDIHFEEILQKVESLGITRVVLDSLAAYEGANRRESIGFLYALASYFKNKLITAVFNYESPELLGVSQISQDLKASHLVDNIILLNYIEIATRLRRAITIPKSRGSNNDKITREFIIGKGGITLIDEGRGEAGQVHEVPQLPFSAYYGILARSPARRSPVIDESVANGEGIPDSPKLTS